MIKNRLLELEKGCGKMVLNSRTERNDAVYCGGKSNLCHKILCSECKAELKGLKEGIEIGKKQGEDWNVAFDCGQDTGIKGTLERVEKMIDEMPIELYQQKAIYPENVKDKPRHELIDREELKSKLKEMKNG